MAAGDAKNRFGELIDAAQREPIVIQKHGRAVAVVLSADAYVRLEDAQWGEQATKMMKRSSFIGTKRSATYVNKTLNEITNLNAHSRSFDFLEREPELYSASDLKKRYV